MGTVCAVFMDDSTLPSCQFPILWGHLDVQIVCPSVAAANLESSQHEDGFPEPGFRPMCLLKPLVGNHLGSQILSISFLGDVSAFQPLPDEV